MIKKTFSILSIIATMAFFGNSAFAQNLYVEPSLGVSVINNVTNANWTIAKEFPVRYGLAIGKDVTKSLAIEEETSFTKLRNSGASIVSETINAKVMVLPSVYAKIGAGAGYIPSTEAHAFEYVAGVGTTSIKPVDLGITVVNANGVGIHNQLPLTAGIKID